MDFALSIKKFMGENMFDIFKTDLRGNLLTTQPPRQVFFDVHFDFNFFYGGYFVSDHCVLMVFWVLYFLDFNRYLKKKIKPVH